MSPVISVSKKCSLTLSHDAISQCSPLFSPRAVRRIQEREKPNIGPRYLRYIVKVINLMIPDSWKGTKIINLRCLIFVCLAIIFWCSSTCLFFLQQKSYISCLLSYLFGIVFSELRGNIQATVLISTFHDPVELLGIKNFLWPERFGNYRPKLPTLARPDSNHLHESSHNRRSW